MVKKAKKQRLKRGRKPGVKVGPHKKRKQSDPIDPVTVFSDLYLKDAKIGDTLRIRLPNDCVAQATIGGNPRSTEKSKSFANCIFEIVNSNMDQQTKLAAFKAMEEAAKTEVVKAY